MTESSDDSLRKRCNNLRKLLDPWWESANFPDEEDEHRNSLNSKTFLIPNTPDENCYEQDTVAIEPPPKVSTKTKKNQQPKAESGTLITRKPKKKRSLPDEIKKIQRESKRKCVETSK